MKASKEPVKVNGKVFLSLVVAGGIWFIIQQASPHTTPTPFVPDVTGYHQCIQPYQEQISIAQASEQNPFADHSSDGTIIASANQGLQNCKTQYPGN